MNVSQSSVGEPIAMSFSTRPVSAVRAFVGVVEVESRMNICHEIKFAFDVLYGYGKFCYERQSSDLACRTNCLAFQTPMGYVKSKPSTDSYKEGSCPFYDDDVISRKESALAEVCWMPLDQVMTIRRVVVTAKSALYAFSVGQRKL